VWPLGERKEEREGWRTHLALLPCCGCTLADKGLVLLGRFLLLFLLLLLLLPSWGILLLLLLLLLRRSSRSRSALL